MSTTLRTGPLPMTGSTRSSPLSSTRAMSEPKMAVAPPTGAVMMVTVLAFMTLRSGSFHVSSGLGTPGGGTAPCGAACCAAMTDTLAMIETKKSHEIRDIGANLLMAEGYWSGRLQGYHK